VEADGIPVMLVRDRGDVHALSDRCAHRGGPLHEGEIADGCVRCPLHGSTFRLRDGSVIQGPSPYPQPVWETRLREGRIEVRPSSD
jgi:nitrite reductase/ring-hydroxylating ferredoxin subunit